VLWLPISQPIFALVKNWTCISWYAMILMYYLAL